MKNIPLLFIICIAMILFVNSCKIRCNDPKSPDCYNYVNPCNAVHPLSADFSIYENDCTTGPGAYDSSWHYYPTDTVYTSCVTFSVNDTSVDSVAWRIGAGTYTTKSFYLYFGTRQSPVPVTLTVYKHRNNCYPDDDTVKTLTKDLYFTDTCIAYGTYKGYFEGNTADTGTITIQYGYFGNNTYPSVVVAGLVPGCSDYYCCAGHGGLPDGQIEQFYRSIHFLEGFQGTCMGAIGSLYYNPDNDSVFANYMLQNNNNAVHHFRGIRIR